MDQIAGSTQTARAQVMLRERILSGDLPAGARLFEVAMAEAMEISRTPVREAMARLAEEGLLERVRGGGFVVRSFSFRDAIDAIELRGVLEGTAARLAAERGVAEERMEAIRGTLLRLDDCFGDALEDMNFEAYASLNEEFHRQLRALSGSAVIEREIERVARLPFASPSSFLADRTREKLFRQSLIPAQAQHHTLVAAIAAGEGTRAEFIAREHARAARRNLEQILSEDPSPRPGRSPLAMIAGEV